MNEFETLKQTLPLGAAALAIVLALSLFTNLHLLAEELTSKLLTYSIFLGASGFFIVAIALGLLVLAYTPKQKEIS